MADKFTISEEAYKNGYDKGYEQGKKDAVIHAKWIIPTKLEGRMFRIPHCSACQGVPCGVSDDTKFCAICGARMDLEEIENATECTNN